MPRYEPQSIEPKWQQFWAKNNTFVTPEEPREGSQDKMYVLDMFPYPSGDGLHVGHPEGYTATDILCRFSRMQGKHVLHPMGWDAFGLPAEQHAIKTGTHPRDTTYKNIDNFRRQLQMLGFSYDWSREISTTDEGYVRWTQWIFLQLFKSWYDPELEWTGPDGKTRTGKARPISELPIPTEVNSAGEDAVRKYQDEHRLAYQSDAPVNWCPGLGTVLSNEEITADGRSEREGHPVERRKLRQWMLRITSFADRLLKELDDLDWPESVKLLQRNWIGKSVGAEVDFLVKGLESSDSFEAWKSSRKESGFIRTPEENVLRVYTTRPDTLFGATYMVIAPEHPLVEALSTADQKEAVADYVRKSSLKSELDRTDLAKGKTGVFSGSYAINPVNGKEIPIWIADYVLISYGTGAIMAVPGHDERDLEFARAFDLPVIPVVQPPDEDVDPIGFTGLGTAINSGEFDGTPTAEFKKKITAALNADGLGKEAVNFRLRDWLFSRQRYWGEPFPIWHELNADGKPTGNVRAVEESELPVRLPDMDDFAPKGTPEPPLSAAPEEWLYRTLDDGTKLRRETNSMPQWAGSCWYYLRFCDPKNNEAFIDAEKEKYWLPVDVYIGGAEHAVLHLLYSRFWHKVLFDLGHLHSAEPFHKLVNQGMILGEAEFTAYRVATKSAVSDQRDEPFADDLQQKWVSSRNVEEKDDEFVEKETGAILEAVLIDEKETTKKGNDFILKSDASIVIDSRTHKMSKSRGNVINPDDIVNDYGADSLRLYEMFMGPLEQTKPWNMSGVEGVYRFLGRVWRMIVDERNDDETVLHADVQDVELNDEQTRMLHKTIKAVTEDIEKLSFNTAISRMMEFTNEFSSQQPRPKSAMIPFVQLLNPFAPHIAEELWHVLGQTDSLTYSTWPKFDESKLVESEIEIPVQINGKLRAKVKVPAEADKDTMESAAKADETIVQMLEGKQIVKTICVPGRMVNFVVKG
ncbi:leucine--tRNA ligase [Rubinisphaera italica]|uniref:Leucine--tRNA ligase n=1 Tax=Rubinisphaera italica TaxID=2527969 RepID=A0A5C5XLV7_9PLAN|nr:leucine--tRNA ligase [Rubinisphaera italica]TWT63539.1 Leucine--tRNA ligase [Rubinisphaera italica]